MIAPPFPDDLPTASIPRISLATLATGDMEECLKLFDACCDQGFVLLDLTTTEDGISILDEVEDAFRIGEEFFKLDVKEKEDFKLVPGNIGYKPFGLIKMKDGKSDLTELCAVSRDSILDASDVSIPQVYQRERSKLQTTIHHLHSVATLVLQVLAKQLDIPESLMADMHKVDSPSSTQLRFLHYPPQKQSSAGQRQESLLGHSDSGSLTILFTKIGGLQIMPAEADENDESAWRWVRPEPGCAIVNIGDPLVQWTGGVLRSAFHRVLYAPGAQSEFDRYSFGYFLKPANDSSMNRLQVGNVIPKVDAHHRDENMPMYKEWHEIKNKMIRQGDQSAIFRGGIKRTPRT